MRRIQQFWEGDEALSTVEYGILLAGLTVLLVAAIITLFSNMGTFFSNLAGWGN